LRIVGRRNTPQPLAEIDAARICIIKPSALGDVIQALPVLAALRGRFPRAHIAWVVNRAYADILAGHPDLDDVITFDRPRAALWSRTVRRSFTELRGTLRRGGFDLTIDLQCLLRSGLMTWSTAAARRLGLGDAREGARLFYTDTIPVPAENMSAVDRYCLVAEALGADHAAKQFRIAIPERDREWAAARLSDAKGLRVVINPGARWPTKRWPVQHFTEIATRLTREFDAHIIVVGGTEDVSAAQQLASTLPRPAINLAGQTTLKQLAAVLARAHLVVTNDSGPMHLAAALGTPVAAIFTCTSPARARPYGAGHVVFSTNVWCAASYVKRCARMECMTELVPDRVWPALRAKLQLLASRAAA
jgi:lipopolysaccharide heptosyltransferase I